jgi:hypothetical protein
MLAWLSTFLPLELEDPCSFASILAALPDAEHMAVHAERAEVTALITTAALQNRFYSYMRGPTNVSRPIYFSLLLEHFLFVYYWFVDGPEQTTTLFAARKVFLGDPELLFTEDSEDNQELLFAALLQFILTKPSHWEPTLGMARRFQDRGETLNPTALKLVTSLEEAVDKRGKDQSWTRSGLGDVNHELRT